MSIIKVVQSEVEQKANNLCTQYTDGAITLKELSWAIIRLYKQNTEEILVAHYEPNLVITQNNPEV